MAMTRQQAFYVGQMMHKLRLLFEKADSQGDKDSIQRQMDRLSPFLADAQVIVIRTTDADFATLSDALAADTKDLTDAIAGIRQIAAGIATAAQVINDLVSVLTAVTGL